MSEISDDLVPVAFAHNAVEADFYRVLLEDHDIHVVIAEEIGDSVDFSGSERGVPVLVLVEQLEEAELVIELRTEIDDEVDDEVDDEADNDYGDLEEIDPDLSVETGDKDDDEEMIW